MAYTRNAVVEQAKSWLGLKESNGSHKKIIDLYNAHKPLARGYKVKYTDAWCATFVSAVSIVLGYTEIIPTECGCDNMITLLKNLGEWQEDDSYTPSAGDIIFYDWQDTGKGDNTGSSDHVGIVEKVNGDTITVIEGNYSNSVKRRTLKVNGKYIRGYGVPKYTTETVPIDKVAQDVVDGKYGNGEARVTAITALGLDYDEVQKQVNALVKSSSKKSVNEIAKEVVAGKWGNGQARKKALAAAGYSYLEVQGAVNKLLS